MSVSVQAYMKRTDADKRTWQSCQKNSTAVFADQAWCSMRCLQAGPLTNINALLSGSTIVHMMHAAVNVELPEMLGHSSTVNAGKLVILYNVTTCLCVGVMQAG